jgi:cyclic pyranopterin phosphate synthase
MLDAFDRRHAYLRLAVTDRCNLRCRYCMPPGGIAKVPHDAILRFEELERLVRVFAGLGIRKVRLTGGEPTVRQGVVELARRIASVPGIETLALTTNGVLLGKLAQPLYAAGVRLVNISLDSLDQARYAAITGRDLLPQVLAGIEAALDTGFTPLKLNVVVMAGINDDELISFVKLARNRPLHVRFIEYMPFLGNGWNATRYLPLKDMMDRLERQYELLPITAQAASGGVAKGFRIEGYRGTVSCITPLSDDFCAHCSRLRITAEGGLKTCLFAPPEISLRDYLRAGATDEQLAQLVQAALLAKPQAHPPADILHSTACQAMTGIGG